MPKKLPHKILPIECADKKFQETWYDARDPLDIPWSFRWILSGPPSSGKSTIIKNHIIRATPPYKKVLICHYDAEGSNEYEDVGGEMISELPDPKTINPAKEKMLLIIEDLNLSTCSKTEREKIDRLFGYSSSHRGVSLALTSQNPLDIPCGARRMANVYTIWKQMDLNGLLLMASRTGYKRDDFISFFKFCKKQHDSITIDCTNMTPYPLRFNGYVMIKKRGEDDVNKEETKTKDNKEENKTLLY